MARWNIVRGRDGELLDDCALVHDCDELELESVRVHNTRVSQANG